MAEPATGLGFLGVALTDHAGLVGQIGIAWIFAHLLAQPCQSLEIAVYLRSARFVDFGFRRPAKRAEASCQAIASIAIERILIQRLPEPPLRPIELTLVQRQVGPFDESRRVRGIIDQQIIQKALGLRDVSLQTPALCQAQHVSGIVRLPLEELLEKYRCFLMLADRKQVLGQTLARRKMVWVVSHRLAVIFASFLECAHAFPNQAAQVQGLAISRRVGQPALQARHRVAWSLGVDTPQGQRFQDSRRFRILLFGPAPQQLLACGIQRASLSVQEQTFQSHGFRIGSPARTGGEQALGLIKVAEAPSTTSCQQKRTRTTRPNSLVLC